MDGCGAADNTSGEGPSRPYQAKIKQRTKSKKVHATSEDKAILHCDAVMMEYIEPGSLSLIHI